MILLENMRASERREASMPLLGAYCIRRGNRGISAGLQLTIFIVGALREKL
jgi:hypothetical protein